MKPLAILIALVLVAPAQAQCQRIYDSQSGQWLTYCPEKDEGWEPAPVQRSREAPAPAGSLPSRTPDGDRVSPIIPRQPWNDARIVFTRNGEPDGAWGVGTGSVVSIGGDASYILTCAHVTGGLGDWITVIFNDGRSGDIAKVVSFDRKADYAWLKLYRGPRREAFTLARKPAKPGETVYAAGFPQAGKLRVRKTTVSKCRYQGTFEIPSPNIEGESGGPIFNERGEIVAVITATDTDLGICCRWEQIASGLAHQTQYGSAGGVYGHGPPPTQPYPPTQPLEPVGPQEPIRECDCAERWAELDARLTSIENNLKFQADSYTNLVTTINQTIDQRLQEGDSPEAQEARREEINIAINQWIKANADPLADELAKRIPPSYLRTHNAKTGTYSDYQKIWPADPKTEGRYSTVDFEQVP